MADLLVCSLIGRRSAARLLCNPSDLAMGHALFARLFRLSLAAPLILPSRAMASDAAWKFLLTGSTPAVPPKSRSKNRIRFCPISAVDRLSLAFPACGSGLGRGSKRLHQGFAPRGMCRTENWLWKLIDGTGAYAPSVLAPENIFSLGDSLLRLRPALGAQACVAEPWRS